jgi:hypothetical protein
MNKKELTKKQKKEWIETSSYKESSAYLRNNKELTHEFVMWLLNYDCWLAEDTIDFLSAQHIEFIIKTQPVVILYSFKVYEKSSKDQRSRAYKSLMKRDMAMFRYYWINKYKRKRKKGFKNNHFSNTEEVLFEGKFPKKKYKHLKIEISSV